MLCNVAGAGSLRRIERPVSTCMCPYKKRTSLFGITLLHVQSGCSTEQRSGRCLQKGSSGNYPYSNGTSQSTCSGIQRAIVVIEGTAALASRGHRSHALQQNDFVFCPGTVQCAVAADEAALLVFERLPADGHAAPPKVVTGAIEELPLLDTGASSVRSTALHRAICTSTCKRSALMADRDACLTACMSRQHSAMPFMLSLCGDQRMCVCALHLRTHAQGC